VCPTPLGIPVARQEVIDARRSQRQSPNSARRFDIPAREALSLAEH
jgi:hypothetical protein